MTRHPFAAVAVAYVAFLLLAGCALNQSKEITAYAAVAATNDTALVLVNAGAISKEDGRKVYEKTHAVRLAIDAAVASGDGTAIDKALAVLREAQAELCKGQETNPNCALLLQQQGATP
jgi:hypothetical protein